MTFFLLVLFIAQVAALELPMPSWMVPLADMPNVDSECKLQLMDTVNHFMSNGVASPVLLNSGKWVNQLGNYKECIADNRTNYILLVLDNLPLYVSLGLCAPKNCSKKSFDATKPILAPMFNSFLSTLKPNGSEANLEVTEKTIVFIDVLTNEKEYTKVTIGTYITIGIFAFFIIMGIFSSVYCALNPACTKANTLGRKIIYSFDVVRNFNGLIKIDSRHDPGLKVFEGIRVGGILWVALGHTFMIMEVGPVENVTALMDYVTDVWKAHTYGALFAVDIFFYLSGFLLCFVLMSSRNSRISWKLVLHRIIRLYPCFLFAYGLFYGLLPTLGGGPVFYYYMEKVMPSCSWIWYKMYSFIYNTRDIGPEACMGWTWYVSVDMQLFLLCLLPMYLIIKKPKIGCITMGVLLVISYVVTIIVSSTKEIFSGLIRMTDDYAKFYYEMPYSRIQPYFIGILTAYFYVISKRENTLPNRIMQTVNTTLILRIICYVTGFSLVIFMLYAQHYMCNYYLDHGRWLDMINLVFSRSVFVLAIFIFCVPAFAGKGRILRMISGSNMMTILSKVTYGVYMTHEGMMEFYLFMMSTGLFASYSELSLLYLSNVVMGYLAGTFSFLFIESPIFNLEDTFLRGRRAPRKQVEGLEKLEEPKSPKEVGSPSSASESSLLKGPL